MIKVLGFCVCEIVIEIGYRNIIKIYFFLDKKKRIILFIVFMFFIYLDNILIIW